MWRLLMRALLLIAVVVLVAAGSVGAAVEHECDGLVATIVGTEGDDELVGTDQQDVIVGLGGNDVISGGASNDVVSIARGTPGGCERRGLSFQRVNTSSSLGKKDPPTIA